MLFVICLYVYISLVIGSENPFQDIRPFPMTHLTGCISSDLKSLELKSFELMRSNDISSNVLLGHMKLVQMVLGQITPNRLTSYCLMFKIIIIKWCVTYFNNFVLLSFIILPTLLKTFNLNFLFIKTMNFLFVKLGIKPKRAQTICWQF